MRSIPSDSATPLSHASNQFYRPKADGDVADRSIIPLNRKLSFSDKFIVVFYVIYFRTIAWVIKWNKTKNWLICEICITRGCVLYDTSSCNSTSKRIKKISEGFGFLRFGLTKRRADRMMLYVRIFSTGRISLALHT